MALIRAGQDSTASTVFEVLTNRLEKEKSFGAMYTTLDRLVDKKFIAVSSPTVSKGKRRRYFSITGEGKRALSQSMRLTESMADGLVIHGVKVGALI